MVGLLVEYIVAATEVLGDAFGPGFGNWPGMHLLVTNGCDVIVPLGLG